MTKFEYLVSFCALFYTTLNAIELGLVGGRDTSGTQPPFAALFDLNGNLIPLSPAPSSLISNGYIQSVAINGSGIGLIGGQNQDPMLMQPSFAAFVYPDGSVVPISTPTSNSYVNAVSINRSGIGLIGGVDGAGSYIAIVDSSNGNVLQFPPLPPPFVNGEVLAVAINNLGVGIAAGYDINNRCFAEIVDWNGGFTLFGLFPPPPAPSVVIYSFAINDA